MKGREWAVLALVVIICGSSLGRAVAQEAVATVETLGDVDLSKGGTVKGRVARVSKSEAQEAVGKYLSGTVRVVKDGGQPSAHIQWRTLSPSPDGGGAAAVPGLSSSAQTGNAASIAAGSKLVVTGSIAALARAASQIGGSEDTKAEEDKQADDAAKRDSTGLETNAIGGGSETKKNDLATPPTLTLPDSKVDTVEVPTDAYGTTREGCEPVISDDGTEVVIMEAPTKNGTVTGACTESLNKVSVQKSFVGCEYDIDQTNLVAYAKSRRYYTYAASTTYIDSDCTRDESSEYEIFESADNCEIVALIPDLTASQYTRLRFLGRRNEVNEVADCAKRTGQTYPIVMDTEQCAMRDDFAAGVTWVRQRPMYQTPDGRLQAAGECADSKDFYTQQKDFSVCDPFADYEAGKLYPQYRIKIAATGANEYRTAVCQPDTTAIANLLETGTGCESFHFDYDGYSLGAVRIVRTDTGAVVRACEEGAVRYEYQRETQGWERDDANLRAYPAEALYINLPLPAGKTYVQQAVVRDDAQPQAYSLLRSYYKNTQTEYVSDQSCDKYQNRDLIEVYQRPDGTEYEHNAGAGTPVGPSYSCTTANTQSWPRISSTGSYNNVACSFPSGASWYTATNTYQGTHTVTRDDGTVIVQDTATRNLSCTFCSDGTGRCEYGDAVSGSIVQNWIGELGW